MAQAYEFLKLSDSSQTLNPFELQITIESKLRKAVVAGAAVLCIVVILYFSYDCLYGFLRPPPDFEIEAAPDAIFLESYEGSSNSTVVALKSLNGFSGDISLKLVKSFGIMGDIRFDLGSDELYLPPNGQSQCTLSLEVVSFVTSGEYFVDVIATAGQVEHTVRVTITVSY